MSIQSEDIGELVKALGAVMKEVGYVRGTGENSHQRYNYTSDEDLAAAVQPAMAKHGIALVPVGCDITQTEVKTAKGTALSSLAIQTWRVGHTSGQWMQVQLPGEGRDSQDKGTAKALTAVRKYTLRLLFCVPTGDDTEKEAKVNGEPDHSDYVCGLLDRIQALQSANVPRSADAAAAILSKARAKVSDDGIRKSCAKVIDWIGKAEAEIKGGA